jgi:starch phosphorylase
MFAGYEVDAITNGVHASTWTSKPFQALFDRRIPGWRLDNFSLRYAHGVPLEELWAAHVEAKQALIDRVNTQANAAFDLDTLTIGFARRATAYKRPYLILQQSERLRAIARTGGTLQIVFARKAHPNDHAGKELIQRIIGLNASLAPEIRMVYLPGYDMELAGVLTSGVDVWLNTPQPPLEASGTSGMKAALNGVPSLSILDGWWIEGCIEGATGWAIKSRSDSTNPAEDAEALYERLEKAVLPMFYQNREYFSGMMRHAIAVNGSFFNTQRMMQQYVLKAYFE